MKIKNISPTEYESLVCALPLYNFLQSKEMYQRYVSLGKEAYLFGGFEENKLKIACLCVCMHKKHSFKIFNVPRGPIFNYDEKSSLGVMGRFLEELSKTLRKKRGVALQISPNIYRTLGETPSISGIDSDWWEKQALDACLLNRKFKYLGEYEQIKWGYVKKLDKHTDGLLKSFRYGCRSSIRNAEKKHGVTIRDAGENELGVFNRIVERTAKRKDFSGPGMNYFKSMRDSFSSKVRFVIAEKEIDKKKIPLAAGMFLMFGGEMIYLFGGSDIKMRKYCGSSYLQWEMIKEAAENGLDIYNFYGTHPFPEAKDVGVFHFKEGFNGEIMEYVGTYARPLNVIGKIYLSKIKTKEYREVS